MGVKPGHVPTASVSRDFAERRGAQFFDADRRAEAQRVALRRVAAEVSQRQQPNVEKVALAQPVCAASLLEVVRQGDRR